MERLDQGHIRPLLEHTEYKYVSAGNKTRMSTLA